MSQNCKYCTSACLPGLHSSVCVDISACLPTSAALGVFVHLCLCIHQIYLQSSSRLLILRDNTREEKQRISSSPTRPVLKIRRIFLKYYDTASPFFNFKLFKCCSSRVKYILKMNSIIVYPWEADVFKHLLSTQQILCCVACGIPKRKILLLFQRHTYSFLHCEKK